MKQKMNTIALTTIALMTAVTCILGPLSIPIGSVPISFTNLAIYFSVYLIGAKYGTISYILYLFIGFVGVPVFSGFTAGAGKLMGPTGGYLIGFIFLTAISGWFIERFHGRRVTSAIGMVLGTAVCYLFGTIWLCFQSNLSLEAGLMVGVIPFIPGDLIKIMVATAIGPVILKQLQRAQ